MVNTTIEKKYELLKDDTKEIRFKRAENIEKVTVYRIKALRSFGDVTEGDLGGYVESEENLSHEGDCWIYDESAVMSKSRIYENAKLYGDSRFSDYSVAYGNCELQNVIAQLASKIYGNIKVVNSYTRIINSDIYGDITIMGNNYITFCNINGDFRLEDIAIYGEDNDRAEIHTHLRNINIAGNAKINSASDYIKIDGAGLVDFEAIFFRTNDDQIKVNLDLLRKYSFDEFKEMISVLPESRAESLIHFIEDTILGEQVEVELPKPLKAPW